LSEGNGEGFAEGAAPIAHFIGHALASALGLVVLTLILLIPHGIVWVLEYLGLAELRDVLKDFDKWLVLGKLALFSFVLGVGALELMARVSLRAISKIRQEWQRI